MGCGAQEEFYGCADIAILGDGEVYNYNKPPAPDAITTSRPLGTVPPPTQNPGPDIPENYNDINEVDEQKMQDPPRHTANSDYLSGNGVMNDARSRADSGRQVCRSAGAWKGQRSMDIWCENNCARNHCPPTHCKCTVEFVDPTAVPHTPQSIYADLGDDGRMEDPAREANRPLASSVPYTPMCYAIGIWKSKSKFDKYCRENCALGFCPESHCACDGGRHNPEDTTETLSTIPQFLDTFLPSATHTRAEIYNDQNDIAQTVSSTCNANYVGRGDLRQDIFISTYCDFYCKDNSNYCPEHICECSDQTVLFTCRAKADSPIAGQPQSDHFCHSMCLSEWCPQDHCSCTFN